MSNADSQTPERPKGVDERAQLLSYVYMGIYPLKGGKSGHFYAMTDSENPLKTHFNLMQMERVAKTFNKLISGTGRPGSVVSCWTLLDDEKPGKTSIWPGTGRFIGYLTDKEIVTALQVQNDARESLKRMEKIANDARLQNELKERLAPLRETYKNATPKERAAILANFISQITG